jgi:hypothetical protein
VKVDGKWILRSIPKKESGSYDWSALPEGDYFIEWRQDGRRPAGNTAAQVAMKLKIIEAAVLIAIVVLTRGV